MTPPSWKALSTAGIVSTLLCVPAAQGFAFSQAKSPFAGSSSSSTHTSTTSSSALSAAKPQRLAENADGVVYVNDKCINCAACAGFAPETFARNSPKTSRTAAHVVHRQPATAQEITHARQALAACPVAAIRVETLAEKKSRAPHHKKETIQESWTADDQWLVDQMVGRGGSDKEEEDATTTTAASPLFPRLFLDSVPNVYWVGHHNSKSFGAVPFLVRVPASSSSSIDNNKDTWILVDSPKFSKRSVQDITSLTGPDGPDYMMLTHVDDTADHEKWAEQFDGHLKRIFHAGDLGRHNWLNDANLERVEVLLSKEQQASSGLTAYALNGTVLPADWQTNPQTPRAVVLHTPGHSPGSISLYLRPGSEEPEEEEEEEEQPGILFTGDTYAYTTNGDKMTGFPRYGNSLRRQAETLQHLLELPDWSVVAPGHGHARDYRQESDLKTVQAAEMQQAIEELRQW